MTIEITREFLGWCSIINMGLLLWWLFFITIARQWTYQMHTRFFQLSESQFNAIHYGGMGLYKLLIILFNVTPYLVLLITE